MKSKLRDNERTEMKFLLLGENNKFKEKKFPRKVKEKVK